MRKYGYIRYEYDYRPMSQDTKDVLNLLGWIAGGLFAAIVFTSPFWVPVNWIVF